ncbi:MAG TPA: DUF192 domain-containing protein [Chloroflexota bacterium]
MKRSISAAMFGIALAALPAVTRASGPMDRWPAHIMSSLSIAGVQHGKAVVYRQNGLRLGVAVSSGGSEQIIWSRPLPADPSELQSPGPAGLVEGIMRLPGSQSAQVFAYTALGGSVRTAIAGHPRGQITADDGASLSNLSFTIRRKDSAHQGGVKYRYQTEYAWQQGDYSARMTVHVPDYPVAGYPKPSGTIGLKNGNVVLIRLEVADTEAARDTGLMNRTALDPDSGMVFVWTSPVQDSFWMENTYIPLSIAFLAPGGTVQEIQDMDPLTTTLHTPNLPYQYAVEANLGYFAAHKVTVGTRIILNLGK